MLSAHDDRVADCRIRAATDVLSHRWDSVVLAALGEGPRRRVELRETIGQIRDKPLSDALARLTSAGLIARRSYRQAPPSVIYQLTSLGRSFHDGPLQALASWAQQHGEELLEPTIEPSSAASRTDLSPGADGDADL